MDKQQLKAAILLLLPFFLTLSCAAVFRLTVLAFGQKQGYLAGFLFYWIFWCLLVPNELIGWKKIFEYYSLKPFVFDWQIAVCLLLPLFFVYTYEFPSALKGASLSVILFSIVLSTVNASMEELLWRAMYIEVFNQQWWLCIVYASFGFALWHYAPQVVFVNKRPGGAHSFVVFSFFLGLVFAYAAKRQQSVVWTTVAHILFDFAGLGARAYV